MRSWYGLFGRTAGIVGFGHNGRELADRLRALGMKVVAYDRTRPEGYDDVEIYQAGEPGALHKMLEKCDFVILTIALTDQTMHLIDAEALSHMKDGATLVNISRGQIIDQPALIEALKSKKLACAGLDVTDPEPLPEDSELWDMENVYITPHVTPQVPNRTERSLEIIRENVRRYEAEEPLINQVTMKDVFTKGDGLLGSRRKNG